MGASGEQIGGGGGLEGVAPFLQQCHVPGKGRRVAGDIDNPPGSHPGQSLDGVGVQPLPGRVNHRHVRVHPLRFQRQRRLACVAAEEFRVCDAVSPGVVLGVLHRLGDDLHADDLPRRPGHGQGNGSHPAVQIENRVGFRDSGLRNGGFVEPLSLVVVHLVE